MGERPDRRVVAAWVLSIVIGGGNPVGVRLSVLELDPFWAAASRFVVAGVILGLVGLLARSPLGSRSSIVGAAIYGAVNFGAAFALIYWGFQETPAGTGQVLVAIVPLLALGLAVVHGIEEFRLQRLAGGLVALGGVGIVFWDQLGAEIPLASLLAVMGGAVCIAEGAVLVKLTTSSHPIVTNAVGMLVGAAILGALSFLAGETWVAPQQTTTWIAFGFLVLGGSVVLYWLLVYVLGSWTASATSYAFLLLPLTAVLYGNLFAGEQVSGTFLIGGAVVLVGVWLGTTARGSVPNWFGSRS